MRVRLSSATGRYAVNGTYYGETVGYSLGQVSTKKRGEAMLIASAAPGGGTAGAILGIVAIIIVLPLVIFAIIRTNKRGD
jgi:hypothetical protein